MPGGYPTAGIGTHFGDTSIVEDVSDIIYQIVPEDTPMYNMTGDARAIAVTHEWQTRTFATRADNAQPEGFTFTFTTGMRLPTRQANVAQIFNHDVRVSRTQQAISHYGIGDMFGDQMMVAMVQKKTDVEHALIRGSLASGSATNTSRRMNGFIYCSSHQTTYTSYGGNITMSEAFFNDHMQISWEIGGRPKDILVHGRMKRHISGFAGGGTKYFAQDEQRVVNTISAYESDFGDVRVHLSRDVPTDRTITSSYSGEAVLFVDRTMLAKAWITKPTAERVPKTADSSDGVVYCELTLECGHPNAHHHVEQSLL